MFAVIKYCKVVWFEKIVTLIELTLTQKHPVFCIYSVVAVHTIYICNKEKNPSLIIHLSGQDYIKITDRFLIRIFTDTGVMADTETFSLSLNLSLTHTMKSNLFICPQAD